ncbi:MAG: transaldolase, partial [Actinobacteria bacterium]|nr:transaldolase [Actinomycetota bacterium]
NVGICSGVTTNPKILADDKSISPDQLKTEILKIVNLVKAPVSVELVSETTEAMLEEARGYSSWAPQYITIKVPICHAGMPVINQLNKEGILTNVTCLMNFNQAYFAAIAGATFVSLFVGRIRDMGYNPYEVIGSVRAMLEEERLSAKIIAGSIRHHQDVADALEAGAHIVTVTPPVLEKTILNPQTDRTIEEFANMWIEFQALSREAIK